MITLVIAMGFTVTAVMSLINGFFNAMRGNLFTAMFNLLAMIVWSALAYATWRLI